MSKTASGTRIIAIRASGVRDAFNAHVRGSMIRAVTHILLHSNCTTLASGTQGKQAPGLFPEVLPVTVAGYPVVQAPEAG